MKMKTEEKVARWLEQIITDREHMGHFHRPMEAMRDELFELLGDGELVGWSKCPVCDGVGKVSNGYYSRTGDSPTWMSSSATPEQCRTCKGFGALITQREPGEE